MHIHMPTPSPSLRSTARSLLPDPLPPYASNSTAASCGVSVGARCAVFLLACMHAYTSLCLHAEWQHWVARHAPACTCTCDGILHGGTAVGVCYSRGPRTMHIAPMYAGNTYAARILPADVSLTDTQAKKSTG